MFQKLKESKAARLLGKAVHRKAPIWVKAIRTLALTAATMFGIDQFALPNLPGRALTPHETVMLRDVFNDSVDYSKIRIHHSSTADAWLAVMGAEGVTRKNLIVIRTDSCAADYAQCKDAYMRYVFTHEAAHVWQAQNGLMPNPLKMAFDNYARLIPGATHEHQYEYSLRSGKDLTAYNVEQQAGIISDFHLSVKKGEYPLMHKDRYKEVESERAAFEATLKNFLHNPAYPRGL